MQLQIVIQLTAESGKPGGRKPEDRRRESRICIRHESGTGSKDSIQPVAVNIQDVALIDGQLLIEQLMHMVRRNDDQRSFRNTGDSVVYEDIREVGHCKIYFQSVVRMRSGRRRGSVVAVSQFIGCINCKIGNSHLGFHRHSKGRYLA